ARALRANPGGVILEAALLMGRAGDLTADIALRAERFLRAGELAFQVGRADLVQRFVEEARALSLSARDAARVELLSESFHDGTPGDLDRVFALVDVARHIGREDDPDLALELLKGAALRCWWSALDANVRGPVLSATEELSFDPTDPRVLAIVGIVAPLERGGAVVDQVARRRRNPVQDPTAAHL